MRRVAVHVYILIVVLIQLSSTLFLVNFPGKGKLKVVGFSARAAEHVCISFQATLKLSG